MAIPYCEAMDLVQEVAHQKACKFRQETEYVSITSALGRICSENYHSPSSTPPFDTSAMDGFAVNSAKTSGATQEHPHTLRVVGTIAAGDVPISPSDASNGECAVCVEIMTGAPFPGSDEFDACIKMEETVTVRGSDEKHRYIQISKPAKSNQNRRCAGNDFQKDDIVICSGTMIQPQHIMALASLGLSKVMVYRRLRVGVISTGSELVSHQDPRVPSTSQIRDSNGPYIEAVLSGLGIEVTNLGIVEDNAREFQSTLSRCFSESPFDAIITSGAVSMGKYDFMGAAIQAMGAKIRFHKTAIRPGHPVLFATIPGRKTGFESIHTPPYSPAESDVAFFGLPGNPLASAVCLRFLAIPYFQSLHCVHRKAIKSQAILVSPSGTSQGFKKPRHLQVFWHGKRTAGDGVTISNDQASNKMRPLLDASCWVGVPPGIEVLGPGDVVEIHEMYPSLGS